MLYDSNSVTFQKRLSGFQPLIFLLPPQLYLFQNVIELESYSMQFSQIGFFRCPLTDKWIKRLWYIYTMEYYSVRKRNTLESVLMRWMNLEPIIQNEVSQKKKNKCMLTHIYGIQKDSTDEPICMAAVEMQTQRTGLWTQQGKEREGLIERITLKCIYYRM